MKKKTIFSVVLIVWCVLCTLSVLQIRSVLANHRQNERDERLIDAIRHDNLDEVRNALKNDEIFFLVKPHDKDIPAIENNEETNDDEKFLPIIIKPRTPGLPYIYDYDLFLRGPWIPMK